MYCCHAKEGDTEENQEILIQQLVGQINQIREQDELKHMQEL